MPRKSKTQKSPRQQAIEKLDSVFSKYIRLRDCDWNWIVECPLCWKRMPRKESQNMHFIKRWILRYRFDETNCHAWCMRCNVILDWNYMLYTHRMIKTYWFEKIDAMINDKSVYKIKTYELEEMIENYDRLYHHIAQLKNLDV